MSRRATAILAAGLLAAAPAPVLGQAASAEAAVEAARAAYGPQAPRPQCPTVQEGDGIVVCAEEQDQEQFRYSGNEAAKERYARETMDKGAPRAPNVAGPGIFQGPATMGFGNVPPPAYMIDFSELPDTPPGSDADRVGRGLAPTGNQAGSAPQAQTLFPGAMVTTIAGEPVSPPESASPAEAQSSSPTPPAGQAPE